MEKDFLEFKVRIFREKPLMQGLRRQIELTVNPDARAWRWVVITADEKQNPVYYGPANGEKFCSAEAAVTDLKTFLTLWCDRTLSVASLNKCLED